MPAFESILCHPCRIVRRVFEGWVSCCASDGRHGWPPHQRGREPRSSLQANGYSGRGIIIPPARPTAAPGVVRRRRFGPRFGPRFGGDGSASEATEALRASCDTLGSMPPLDSEALPSRAPVRLRMRSWVQKTAETATRPLAMSAPEADTSMELELAKRLGIATRNSDSE